MQTQTSERTVRVWYGMDDNNPSRRPYFKLGSVPEGVYRAAIRGEISEFYVNGIDGTHHKRKTDHVVPADFQL